jgi:outer membrane protein assembly factor BamB
MTRYDARRLTAVLAVTTLAACTSSGSAVGEPQSNGNRHTQSAPAAHRAASAAAATPGPEAAWPTYHGDNRRTGVSGSGAIHAPLHRAWSRQLDGAVYAQPIVVGKRLIVATENNTVYAFRRGGGHLIWRHHLGTPVPLSALPCGNIDPTGITGSPAYDRATGSIFVVTETTDSHHTLRALNWRNGHVRWHRSVDVLPNRDRHAEQQRGALLVAHGRVYVAFGGRAGDCGNYVGYVVGVPKDGTGRSVHYAVPTDREAGIWAPPGPIAKGRSIYVASGNGAETNGQYDGSDSVIRLSPKLNKTGLFAPSTWQSDNAADLDLGSSSPVPVASTGDIVIAGKRGTVYLLNGMHGIGGQADTLTGCAAYGGGATKGGLVVLPCDDGIRRLDVSGHHMQWRWQLGGVSGSPVIAGKRVYALDTDSGELVLARLGTGHETTRISVGGVSRFATPAPVGSFVYVGTLSGVVAIRGS